MNIELDSLSLAELRDLRARTDRAIASFENRRKREALAAAEKIAKEHGFNLAELTGSSKPRSSRRAPAEAKYAHPENRSLTWSGRGRRPAWVVSALESGQSLEDLAI